MEIITPLIDWTTHPTGEDMNRIEQNIEMLYTRYRNLQITAGRYIEKLTTQYSFYERTVFSQYVKLPTGYRLIIRKINGAFINGDDSVADNYTPVDNDKFYWEVWLRDDITTDSNPSDGFGSTLLSALSSETGLVDYVYDEIGFSSSGAYYYDNATGSTIEKRLDFAVCQVDNSNNDVVGFANLYAVVTFEPIPV